MSQHNPAHRAELLAGAERLQVTLSPVQCEALLDYLALLVKWNKA